MTWSSSVDTVSRLSAGWTAEEPRFDPEQGQESFPDLLWGDHKFPYAVGTGVLLPGQ